MHSLLKKVTLWGLAGVLAVGLGALPGTARPVDANGGYASPTIAVNNTVNLLVVPNAVGAVLAAPALPPPSSGSTAFVDNATSWYYYAYPYRPSLSWIRPSYVVTGVWRQGAAPLGYGNGTGGQATTVTYGSDPNNKYISVYFRKTFSITDPKVFNSVTLTLVHDDGAVVYLNGTIIANPNMAAVQPSYGTLAKACNAGVVETYNVPASLLVAGTNILGVEVHQCAANSANMIFNASLYGQSSTPPTATTAPTSTPTEAPASAPTVVPTKQPATVPTPAPTVAPTKAPTAIPTQQPTAAPTKVPTKAATTAPTTAPTKAPTNAPTRQATAAPTTPANNSGLPPAPSGQSWAYRWGDEFNGTSIDTSKWQIDNKTRAEDPNKTYYIPQNASVSNGTLKLLVKHETYSGANYTGAMLELTGNYRRNRYGYFEARIKYNFQGPGWWANFWMCGVDQWPPEFDNEIVAQHPGAVYLANHYKDASGTDRSSNTYGALDYNQWHTYGVLWLPGKPVQFYLDGKLAFTASSPSQNPPTVDMYMALRAGAYYNSTWGGTPNSTTVYPGSAEYDWVHVYQAQ